jgi:hypothetical protein
MTAQAMLNLNGLRVEFLQSGQSEILRFAQNDSEGLRMTALEGFSAVCKAPPFQFPW